MLESLRKNGVGIGLMSLSALCVCFGQLLWKLSSNGNNLYLLMGFAIYGIGAVIMIVAYRFGSLSVLQPVLSLNYVLSLVLAKIVLDEVISLWKVVGVSAVILGVILIGGSDE